MTTFKKEAVEQLKKLARECLNVHKIKFYSLKSKRKELIKHIKVQKKAISVLETDLKNLNLQFKDRFYQLAVTLPVQGGLAALRSQLKFNRFSLKKLDVEHKSLKEKFIEINALFDSLGFRVHEDPR